MILDFRTNNHQGLPPSTDPYSVLVYGLPYPGARWVPLRVWYADTRTGKFIETTGNPNGSAWFQVKFCLPMDIPEPRDEGGGGEESDGEPWPPDDPSRQDVERALEEIMGAMEGLVDMVGVSGRVRG